LSDRTRRVCSRAVLPSVVRGRALCSLAGCGIVALLTLAASRACALGFALPIDVQQGLEFGAAHPRTPYLFEVQIAPGLEIGPFRASALVAPSYVNPRWDLGLGGQLSILAQLGPKGVGLRLAIGAEYLPRSEEVRIAAGLVGEVFGLLRIGVWPEYALDAKHAILTASVGFDIARWVRLLNEED
jgi:hypothetical protein